MTRSPFQFRPYQVSIETGQVQSLDEEDVHPSLLKKVKTKKTELLFVALILRMLKSGGRSATIVPDGVLFGSSKAHIALRQYLIDENQLEAVISLPSGVFKPYAGVSTAILVFSKGGTTNNVMFFDVHNDGYSLDDKRLPIDENDIPNVLSQYRLRHDGRQDFDDRSKKGFSVSVEEIRGKNYNLSLSQYKQIEAVREQFEHPSLILGRMKNCESKIQQAMSDLESMI